MSDLAKKEIPPPGSQPTDRASQNNIQDQFLNNLRKDRSVVNIYLVGGIKLTGKIKGFDKYALVLDANNQEQLIFKHAISTVAVVKSAQTVSQAVQTVEA